MGWRILLRLVVLEVLHVDIGLTEVVVQEEQAAVYEFADFSIRDKTELNRE
jgi:hypothetical protein